LLSTVLFLCQRNSIGQPPPQFTASELGLLGKGRVYLEGELMNDPFLSQLNSRLGRLLRDEVGTSTAEYAIIIALIATSIMLASDAVRLAANSSFRRAAVALGDEPSLAGPTVDGPPAVDPPNNLPILAVAGMSPIHALAWGVLLAATSMVIHNRYRETRRARVVQVLEFSAEPLTEEPTNPNFKKRQEIQRVLLRHFDDAMQNRIEVRHVMSRKVRTVEPHARLADLQAQMNSEGFHHLLVVRHETLVGVISDRDVSGKKGSQAAHVMTGNPLTISPTTHISHAISAMLQRRISCLPVVEKGQIKGILTTTDMLMSLQCLMRLLEQSHSGHDLADSGSSRAGTEKVMNSAPIAVAT